LSDHVGKEREAGRVVLRVLAESERARNCDKFLLLRVWSFLGWNPTFPEENLGLVCSPESVTRSRRLIQNDKDNPRFLPTDAKVVAERGIKEEQLRSYYGGRRDDIITEYIFEKYGV